MKRVPVHRGDIPARRDAFNKLAIAGAQRAFRFEPKLPIQNGALDIHKRT
jgi:hypothetical protein